MTRLTAKDFAPELLELYDGYAHGKINRREFLDRAALFTLGGLTASALLAALSPNYALAEQVKFTDPDIVADYINYPSPKGNGTVRGYLAMMEAALQGAGVAMAPAMMFSRQLERDVIRQPFEVGITTGSYWLTRLQSRAEKSAMVGFKGWLKASVG